MTHPVRIYTSEGWIDLATVGPPGPSGPQGIQGIQGPVGATGPTVDTSAFVQKSGDTMTGTLYNNYTAGGENIILAGSDWPGLRIMPTVGATQSTWIFQQSDWFFVTGNTYHAIHINLVTGHVELPSGGLVVKGYVTPANAGGDNIVLTGNDWPGINFKPVGGTGPNTQTAWIYQYHDVLTFSGAAGAYINLNLVNGSVTLGSTAVSSAYTNGALIVTGGVGIGGQLNVNGNINGNQAAYFKNTISVGTAALKDGTIYFGSDNTSYLMCNGGGWSFTGSPTGGVYFSNNTIMINSSLTSPTATGILYFNGSATKYIQYDGNVIVVGGAKLYLSAGDPTDALGAATKQYVDKSRVSNLVYRASGSGTYTTPAGCVRLRVRLVGGGSGGCGGGNPGATQPGGGNTTFGGLTAGGASGPGGGSASGATICLSGGNGSYGYNGDVNGTGGPGGNSPFGGGGGGVAYMNTGGSGMSSTGGGGAGGDSNSSNGFNGPGGGAGGYCEHVYNTPAGSYSFAVGAGGGNGYPGTGGSWGGSGGSGLILIEEFF